MADSDDENFVTFGNALEPLDEESLPRKKPVTIEDQYAVDAQGRRRFHGAFTGGFSAGYFNSVGTRDGWRPQQFKSSRSSKAGGVSQRPEDFMDEEDTSEFGIAPTAIRAHSDFTDHGRRGTKRERQRPDNDGPIPGVPVLKELLKPAKDTVGVTLLKKMGWRPGQGIGPRITKREKVRTKQRNDRVKVYGCSLPNQEEKVEDTDSEASEDANEEILFAPDDYEPFICNPKDNYFGIGYTGLDRRPVLSGHVNLFEEPTSFKLQEKNKKLSIRGQAFGVGAFEADDEDIYARDDMSRYDFALGPEKKAVKSRWSEKHNESSKENYLEGFVPATKNLERKKTFDPPELPRDFEPVHTVRKSRFHPPIEPIANSQNTRNKGLARPDLSATDRARILGESSQNFQCTTLSSPVQGIIDSKPTSVASNIITRTLNLHGKEQTAERKQQDSRNKSASAAWLEKLSSKSFVSGGVENRDSGASGSLKNLQDFKTDIAGSRVPKPFVMDPEKQSRFEKFVALVKKGEKNKLESIQPLSMTEWERQQESHEFEQAIRIFDVSEPVEESPKSFPTSTSADPTMSGKFVGTGEIVVQSQTETAEEQKKSAAKMKLFGKLTRTREPWQPASIVCKRFNIPEPRSGCPKMEKTTKNKRCSVFESLDFGAITSKFEGSTEPENSTQPHIPYVPKENPRDETVACTGIFDSSDIDPSSNKVTEKMRSFEVSYEKVFGRSGLSTSVNDPAKDLNSTDLQEQQEHPSPSEESTSVVAEAKGSSAEKKDLFKAIFLSSSEDSESDNGDNDEDDTEAVKSLLIGKAPSQLNLQRNNSPPRGIFAKLDLDSLSKPRKVASSLGAEESSSKSQSVDEKSDTIETNNGEVEKSTSSIPSTQEIDLLPDMYGPALPTRTLKNFENSLKDEGSSSRDSVFQKPIFKSVVVTKKDSEYSDRIKGKWVERSKSKKSKKDKHKHKHKEKERSKHKHKSKKDKR